MTPSPAIVLAIAVGVAAYLGSVYLADRALVGIRKVVFRYFVVAATIAGFFIATGGIDIGAVGLHWPGLIGKGLMDYGRATDITKALIAIAAAAAVFYEQQRVGERRPVAERWKRFVGLSLAIAAIVCYFEAFRFGYPKFFHRWDQYHYYMGAKYFREMGYDGLYKCSVIAEDELGVVKFDDEDHIGTGRRQVDLSKEIRHPDKKIRNLGADNLLMPVTEVLEHPEACKAHFSPARWELYKQDVAFFRLTADKKWWDDMQGDHGFNPPPVWTIAGYYFSNLFPAGRGFEPPLIGHVNWLQCLAMLDIAYLAAMFVALWWAFGWRVCAVAGIYWGCQAAAPTSWTQGAFLRQDWLFFLVFAACTARKRWYALSGASMVYAGLLRVFPGLAVIGWLAVTGWQLVKHRRLTGPQLRMLGGGVLAAAVLIPWSLQVSGKDAYQEFFKHTLQVHDRTPLTNHMGLRVLVSQKVPFEIAVHKGPVDFEVGTGPKSGRMKYTQDGKLVDPFEVWMRMRNERYDKLKLVAYAITALSLAYFLWVTRRIKSMWVAQCLGQIFIILMSQLTSYYYSFMILLAPLTKARRQMEAPLFGFAALSQFVFIIFGYNDDKYWMLTALSLVACYATLCVFLSAEDRAKVARLFGRKPAPTE
jgi:hypothetical protein